MGMATLDVRPHSRRLSALAVAGLSVLAPAAFATGKGRQLAASAGPPPVPPAPEIQPAPQPAAAPAVATAPPSPRRRPSPTS